MHNIKILLFCWKLPSIPPPGADHVTLCGSGTLSLTVMAASGAYTQFESGRT